MGCNFFFSLLYTPCDSNTRENIFFIIRTRTCLREGYNLSRHNRCRRRRRRGQRPSVMNIIFLSPRPFPQFIRSDSITQRDENTTRRRALHVRAYLYNIIIYRHRCRARYVLLLRTVSVFLFLRQIPYATIGAIAFGRHYKIVTFGVTRQLLYIRIEIN